MEWLAPYDENFCVCDACGEIFLETDASDTKLCLSCQIDPLPLGMLCSLWYLSPEVRSLISALKYRGQLSLANYFRLQLAQLFQQAINMGHAKPDLIVALPSGIQTLRQRGYSHTALIALALGKILEIPVELAALSATGPRPRQTGLLLRERRKNIRNAFTASAAHVAKRKILLFDDVVTSGSSLVEATNTLLRNGAATVNAITLARSRHFRRYRLVLAQQKIRAASKLASNEKRG